MAMSGASLSGASDSSFGALTRAQVISGFKPIECDSYAREPITLATPAGEAMPYEKYTPPKYYER